MSPLDQIEEIRKVIIKCSLHKEQKVIELPGLEEIDLAVSAIISTAKKEIKILCTEKILYADEFMCSIEKLLRKNIPIKIIISKQEEKKFISSEFYNLLSFYVVFNSPDSIIVKSVDFSILANLKKGTSFVLGDKSMYVLFTSADSGSLQAKVNYNDSRSNKVFNRNFDTVFGNDEARVIVLTLKQ